MKKIAYIVLIAMITQLGFVNTYAAGFPDEPMTVYWNIVGASSTDLLSLEIYDWNNTLLQTVGVNNGKYWTNQTFDFVNKIVLNTYTWALNFKILRNWISYNVNTTTKWEVALCNNSPVFQKWYLCQYNLNITLPANTLATTLSSISINKLSTNIAKIKTTKAIVAGVKNNLLSSLLADLSMSDVNKVVSINKIIVSNKNIKTSTWNTILEDTLLLSTWSTVVEKKNTLFLPKNINLSKSNITIDTPREIVDKVSIKNKIGKWNVVWAIDIPTSSNVGFTNNKIQVCMYVNNSNTKWKIYSSTDSVNWNLDTNISNLQVANNQACFNVNHLTSFAVVEDAPAPVQAPTVSHGGWWGGGGSSYYSRTIRSSSSSTVKKQSTTNTWVTNTWTTNNISNNNTTTLQDNINILDKVIKINSKDYISSVIKFNSNKRKLEKEWLLSYVSIKWDDKYNTWIQKIVKKVNFEFNLNSLKGDLIKYLDNMTISYWIYNDSTIDKSITDKFKQKFEKDKAIFNARYKVIKVKDYIINRTLKKRAAEKLKLKK